MFNNLKLSTKITFGFAVIMAIMMALGATAIYNLLQIRANTTKLADEYMPQVDLTIDIERFSMLAMFEMRGFNYTEHKEFLDKSLAYTNDIKKTLDQADELVKNSPNLVRSREALPKIRDEVNKYLELMHQTKQITEALATQRNERNKAFAEYSRNLDQLTIEQTKAMEQEIGGKAVPGELKERLWKIGQVHEIVELGSSVRINNYMGEAAQDSELLKKALTFLPQISKNLDELLAKATHTQVKTLISNTQKTAENWEAASSSFLENWLKREAIGKERLQAANNVQKYANELAELGIKATVDLAHDAKSVSNSSVMVLIFGLLLALLAATVAAVVIIRNITVPVRSATDKLTQSNTIITDIAQQLSAASQQLSAASSEQASFVEETSSSLEELAGMVENNVSNAQKAVELSGKVKEISEVGNNSMKHLEESMQEILRSNERIEQLVKLIENIAEKTQVMDEIVFQTKLLSFNASVEAERAGEHGRGFAVVAQEVGNLAQMSGKSAQEIAEIVRTSIKDAETITRENREKVQNGNRFVAETARILSEITVASRTVEEGSQQVLSASQDQAKGIKQINVAMTEIDKSTQQNASTSEETASSSEELASQVGAMAEIVADVTKLVEGAQGAEALRLQQSRMMQQKSVKQRPTSKTHPAAPKAHLPADVPSLGERRAQKTKHMAAALKPSPLKKAVGAPEMTAHSSDGSASDEWESL
jgi:methyl-accepting chemotaxis protein